MRVREREGDGVEEEEENARRKQNVRVYARGKCVSERKREGKRIVGVLECGDGDSSGGIGGDSGGGDGSSDVGSRGSRGFNRSFS
uniref:Uncharacterized protein n=1 Tax=Vespula pensylvanica TaxID=30213 RepID=A0A834NZR0_VESPE|nr:hypothetical protein H0235_008429 [Vespula pensylvanica]